MKSTFSHTTSISTGRLRRGACAWCGAEAAANPAMGLLPVALSPVTPARRR